MTAKREYCTAGMHSEEAPSWFDLLVWWLQHLPESVAATIGAVCAAAACTSAPASVYESSEAASLHNSTKNAKRGRGYKNPNPQGLLIGKKAGKQVL